MFIWTLYSPGVEEPRRQRPRKGQHAHHWASDACSVCLLRRREDWVLNADGQAVMALVWMTGAGDTVRVLEFAYFTGMRAPVVPVMTLDEAYPGVRVGREPKCPGQPTTWVSSHPQP